MGCFTLPFFKKIVILITLLFLSLSWAKEIEGVNIPDKIMCGDKELPLSGAGLRTATFLKVKVFVLALYAQTPIRKGNGTELEQRPICVDLTYLKNFDNSDVDRAWAYQFKESSEHNYSNLESDLKKIKSFFGEIKGDRRQSFILSSESTKVFENKELKGEITGKDFQQSFLSIWFGKNPPTEDLKNNLLKGF